MAHSEEQLQQIQKTLRQVHEFARPGYYYHYDEPSPENPTRLYRVAQGPAIDKRTLTLAGVQYTAEYPPYNTHVDPPIVWERPLFSPVDAPEDQRDGFADPIQELGGIVLRRFNFSRALDEPTVG